MRKVWGTISEESASVHVEVEKIRIGFTCQDGQSDFFKVHESLKVHELVRAFCKKRNIEYKFAKFVFNGKKLPHRGTIAEAGLADQDEIEVLIDQTSG